MKKILLLLLLIVASFQGFSQTPGISYQAVILNPNIKELPGANAQTSILANSKVAVRFTIINELNEQEYQEYHVTNTDAYGMINLLIGHGTRSGSSYFEDILWNGLSKKLKVDINFSGTVNNFTFLTEQQLTFMPQPALGQDSQAILDNTTSILAEVVRATAAESVIQSNLDAIELESILGDEILQDNIDNVQMNVNAIETNVTAAIEAVQEDVDANEVASILADATLQTNINNVQSDVDANEATATAAIESVQEDVDANEAASILADATLQTNINNVQSDVDANEATATAAIEAVQEDVDANEAASILADATLQTNINNVQSDVDANEATATAAIEAVQEDVDANEAASILADVALQTNINNVQADVDANASNIGVLTDLTTTAQNNLVSAINEIDLEKANLESPNFTGIPLAPTPIAGTSTTQIATTAFVTDAIATAETPDATATVKGKVQLAGDLTGTAALPTIANAAVTTDKIADDAVTSDKILDVNVTSDKLAAGSVTTDKITDVAVTEGKIASSAITTVKINDGAVVSSKIAESPSFTGIPLAPTATAGTNTTQIATTAFVANAVTTATTGSFVDLTTNQTIAGVKRFSSDAEINGVTVGRGNFNENSNTAIGLGALGSNAGYANTGIGRGALAANVNGGGNTALGYIALSNNISGTDNVAIGTQTLETNSTGSGNTAIGKHADVASDGISNSVAIGANAIVTASNTIQLGSDGSGSHTAITSVKTSGNITAASYIKSGGTSSEYLMADGSVSTGPSGVVSGSGTSNYLPKFTAASTLGNSSIYDNGTNVGIGTNNPSSMFQIGGEGTNDLNLKFDAVSNSSSALKFGYRNFQWRLKMNTNSGTLDPLVFSYFNGTTDITRLTLTNSGLDIPNNLNITGNTIGSNASFSGNLLVNTNQLSVNTTTNRVGVFTSSPTSMFQIGDNDQFTNQLKYDYGGSVGTLKFGFRNNEFRMKTLTNSGVLLDLIFSYYNNSLATDVESMRISNTGLVTINNLRISGGNPGTGKVLTSDATGGTSWVTPQANNPVREVADEFSATASQTSFTLTQIPSVNSKVKMYINGIRISNSAYSTSGTTFTYIPANNGGNALTAGDRIQMDYYY